ncbi:polysaccharide deacetylase family protein [Haloplasma contractile]|uniref:Chitin deacetylase protein n=1 Tax=Haloplasma contractile SSD-17B TaxID=1033810 RepID=U2EFH8_9MOLU|nr:polysaccharide deacetylase family protein [Haloplasma contractile]ERJ13688.1 chitin deacetylase protein [Haloplasma contractile SSD-17B]
MKKIKFIIFLFLVTFATTFLTTSDLDHKAQEMVMMVEEDSLRREIMKFAEKNRKEPINARYDKVWRNVPGYDGYAVDIEKSYELMSDYGEFDENKIIYKPLKPNVSLADLDYAPIYRGNEHKDMVTIIVNVAWGEEYLEDMLTIFDQNNVKVNFFLEGRWARKNVDYLFKIHKEGHLIGNHSYSHPDFRHLSKNQLDQEINKTNDFIERITYETPKYLGPPSGAYNNVTVQAAGEHNMYTVLWTVDTVDWKKPMPEVIKSRVLNKVHPGAIILMHPTKNTVLALDEIIKGIKEKGLEISTLEDLLSSERVGAIHE